jgi:hypothetical protein
VWKEVRSWRWLNWLYLYLIALSVLNSYGPPRLYFVSLLVRCYYRGNSLCLY